MDPIQNNKHTLAIVIAIFIVVAAGFLLAPRLFPGLIPGISSFLSGLEIEKRLARNFSGSCKILKEKYCKEAALGEQENYAYIGFNLPPGTLLFAPWSGNVNAQGFSLVNPKATVLSMILDVNGNKRVDPAEDISFSATGDLEALIEGDVLKGTPIARVKDAGVVVFEDYNLFIDVSRYDTEKKFFVPNADLMKEWFPASFK